MSSSQSSLSSSDPARPHEPIDPQFAPLRDVRIGVSVLLGTGSISVRECLALAPRSVVRLSQSAGEDVQVVAGVVPIARAEVVIVEDSTAVRLTEILKCESGEPR